MQPKQPPTLFLFPIYLMYAHLYECLSKVRMEQIFLILLENVREMGLEAEKQENVTIQQK